MNAARTITLALGAAALGLAAACGSQASQAPGTAASPAQAGESCGPGTTVTGGLCATAPAPAPSAAANGPGERTVAQTARPGQPFTVTYPENGVSATWKVTLDSIRCGDGHIFSAKVLAADAASMGEAPPATPQPEPGNQFCLARFSVVNEGDSSQPWMAYEATVNVGMRAYESDSAPAQGYDPETAYTQEAQPAVDTSDFGINPGVHAVSWGVWEIPASSHATSVSVDGSSTGDAPASTSPVVLILLGAGS